MLAGRLDGAAARRIAIKTRLENLSKGGMIWGTDGSSRCTGPKEG